MKCTSRNGEVKLLGRRNPSKESPVEIIRRTAKAEMTSPVSGAWIVRCPVCGHELSIKEGEGGSVVSWCEGGCHPETITNKLGVKVEDSMRLDDASLRMNPGRFYPNKEVAQMLGIPYSIKWDKTGIPGVLYIGILRRRGERWLGHILVPVDLAFPPG
jgi:hypothetical protein